MVGFFDSRYYFFMIDFRFLFFVEILLFYVEFLVSNEEIIYSFYVKLIYMEYSLYSVIY